MENNGLLPIFESLFRPALFTTFLKISVQRAVEVICWRTTGANVKVGH